MSRIAKAAGVALVALPAVCASQGWIEPVRPLPGGRIEKLRSAVHVVVSGRAAAVTVEEWFRNAGPVMDQASYLYPLPGEAAFSDFSLWQGDQELKGEMMDAGQARSIYESIVRAKRDPALIELAGHGVLRARVFPINPGETRKITLRYTQLLDRAGDAWRFRFAAGPIAAARSFHIDVDSASRFGDPYSPTHRVTTTRTGERLGITVPDSSWSGDLELLLPLTRGLVGLSALTYQPVGDDGHFMLVLAPGAEADAPRLARDLVAVLDVSGSMAGDKLEQGKAALRQLVSTLRPGDRFRLIAFSGDVRRATPGWTDASASNLAAADAWIQSLSAGGSTNIAGALHEAFAAPPAEGALGIVVFLTDGLPTVGESDPERLADSADQGRGPFRVFSFGIGYDVNTYLLDRLAERARGCSEYVPPGGNIEAAVGTLAARIASPVMTDVVIAGDGAELYDVQPGSLPDLFAGDELIVFGRYRTFGRDGAGGSRGLELTVTGRRSGRTVRFTTSAPTGGSGANEYIAHLWAARKAGALGREIRLHGATPEVMNALKELALRYGILTEYTAYLVQEPGAVAVRTPEAQPVPARQFGGGAVEQARRDAKAASASVAADAGALDEVARAQMGARQVRQVGGRAFVWRDSAWTDLAHGDSQRIVGIEAFTPAYFDLLAALPEVRKAAVLQPIVLIGGRRISIKIGAAGISSWREGELAAVVREFRT
ncbi:MAG TPA: VIT domain-containing protein [Gemmatimonadales bacterium]|nr:VIT domain-containing protein [Gemmatimonadales bacterium]